MGLSEAEEYTTRINQLRLGLSRGLEREHRENERLCREVAWLRLELARKNAALARRDEALLQLRTHFQMGRNNIDEAERVFAGLDGPTPLADAG